MHTRRFILAALSSTAVAAPLGASAASFSFRIAPQSRRITWLKLRHQSAQSSPAGTVTQLIGLPFRKGDIPSGEWPKFELADGTEVPCTFLDTLATRWSDRSLKFVPVMLQLPVAVEAHAKLVVNVLSGGWLSQSGARTIADLSNGISPQVHATGLDNLPGTWVMDVGKAIRRAKPVTCYGNGAAGAVWKIRAHAEQKGQQHPQLLCDFYAAALSNLDGSLKGFRILGKVKLPYYDSAAPMKWVSFSRLHLYRDGQGNLIRDCFGKNFGPRRSYPFQWQSGSVFAANHGYSTANYGDYNYCTRLSSTGGLPAGLSPNTSYFTGHITQGTIGFRLNSCGGAFVSASDPGSGTHTATPYPYLAYFGSLFTAGPEGRWDYVQGPGSDACDTDLRCEIDQKYWLKTRLIPSYDLSIRAARNVPAQYWPNSAEPVTRYLSTEGERDDLGVLPSWYVRHFLTQSATDERVLRVISLVGGQFSIGLENSQTGTLPVVNNGIGGTGKPYRRMPAPNPNFSWGAGRTTTVGFPNGDTTDPNVRMTGFSQQDSSHMPQFNYYPYLFTGEPWHLDMLLEHANNAVYQRIRTTGQTKISMSEFFLGTNGSGVRNLAIPSKPMRYGITIGNSTAQQRSDAWASALLAAAAGICPDLHPDCPSYKQYFGDMNAETWAAAKDIIHALPSFARSWGLWSTPYQAAHTITAPWQMAYLGAAIGLAYGVTENGNAKAALAALTPFFDQVVSTFGGWHAAAFHTLVKSGNPEGSPLVDSDAGIAFEGPILNWSAGGHFVVTPFSNYVPSNGDKIIFADTVGHAQKVTPAGFSKYTPYYITNLNGVQFDLSTVPGGAAIPPGDSYNGHDLFYIAAKNSPPSGSMDSMGSPKCYNSEVLGMLSYAFALGVRVQPGTIADLLYRNQQANIDYTSDPKWGMAPSFPR